MVLFSLKGSSGFGFYQHFSFSKNYQTEVLVIKMSKIGANTIHTQEPLKSVTFDNQFRK